MRLWCCVWIEHDIDRQAAGVAGLRDPLEPEDTTETERPPGANGEGHEWLDAVTQHELAPQSSDGVQHVEHSVSRDQGTPQGGVSRHRRSLTPQGGEIRAAASAAVRPRPRRPHDCNLETFRGVVAQLVKVRVRMYVQEYRYVWCMHERVARSHCCFPASSGVMLDSTEVWGVRVVACLLDCVRACVRACVRLAGPGEARSVPLRR